MAGSSRLYVATGERFARVDGDEVSWALPGSGARCLAIDPRDADVVFAGGRQGLWRSGDGGHRWDGCRLPQGDVFAVAVSAADGAVYAGTEPSRVFRSRDGGATWEELEALQDVPSRPRWSFPPRPWTSHVRWIAPDPHDSARLLVGIELGGVLLSEDDGRAFLDHRPGAQPDVHGLAWHPTAAGRAYEAGGGGAAWSRDGGRTWRPADAGRDLHYVWAVAPDPADPDRWFVSAARGPREAHGPGPAGAALYRWDGDGPWRRLVGDLPALPYALVATANALLAGLGDGRLLRSDDGGEHWEEQPVRAERVLALAVVDG